MPIISTDIPNLTGGVSQQPDAMRLINQCEAQENAVPSLVEGLKKRPPTKHVAELIASVPADCFIHHVNRDSDEQYFVVIDGAGGAAPLKVFDMAGVAKTVTVDSEGSSAADIPAYFTVAGGEKPREVFKAVTIADVTFFVDTTKVVEQAATLSTYSMEATSPANEALIVVKLPPSNYSKCDIKIKVDGHDVGLDDGTDTNFGYGTTVGSTSFDAIQTATLIAAHLNAQSFAGAPWSDSLDLTAADTGTTTVHVTGNEAFNITASDGQGNQIVQVIKDSVENFADLPSVAPHNFKIKVQGNPETDIDDYYVKFVSDNNQAGVGTGKWVETTAGGIKNTFNYTTMPHVLVRQADGTFKLNAADGSFTGGTTPPMGNYKFAPRMVGDETTNPAPTFVGSTISDIAFFKNRLVLLSGENVIMSEAAEYFSFYRTTVAQLLDSAVIDLAAGGTTVSNLSHAVPFSDRLVLFSDTSQFSLQSEQFLSPLTASITSQTAFEAADVRPVVSGTNLFFGFTRGSFSGVKQFFKVNEIDIQFDAVDVTAQVPKYLSGNIKALASTTHEDILFALTDTDDTSLYCYKYFNNQGQRVQSSWSKFTFGGSIYSMFFVDTTLYLLIKRGTALYLEKMQLETGLVDTGQTYVTYLDRRVDKAAGQGVYSASTNRTTWSSLGYTPSADAQVITDKGLVLGVTAQGSGTIEAKGDHSATAVYIGEPYTMRYELSKPIIKSTDRFGNQRPVISTNQNRLQLRYMTLIFSDTAYFKVQVTPEYGSTSVYSYTGRQYGDSSSTTDVIPSTDGDFRVPVFSQPDRVKIELVNDSGMAANFQAVQLETDYTKRSQRMD